MRWDIFCKVIDNHGDVGVCWRLSAQLAQRGERVRLWLDDPSALQWMAPAGHPLVEVHAWHCPVTAAPGDVVVEAFGCELDAAFQQGLAAATRERAQPVWVNLEYLSAEAFTRRSHGLPSPVLSGPAAELTKYFFYPGFAADTGGLLREPDLVRRRAAFDAAAWLRSRDIEPDPGERVASLFCYEPTGLPHLLRHWSAGPSRTRLLVTAGRAAAAVRRATAGEPIGPASALAIEYLPLLPQDEFDHLLWSCDLNFVRGEDSLVRALWAGRPFVWQLYPQSDGAHLAKLDAFLQWLDAPPSWRDFHRFWNGAGAWAPPDGRQWASAAASARDRLLAQGDLVSKLLAFVAAHRG